MRKLVILLHMSLDGVIEGPKGAMDIGFVNYSEELEQFANKVLSTCDTILWGRATYEMMLSYWPAMLENPEATEYERRHAAWIEQVQKVVCSKTLTRVDWHNTQLIQSQLTEKVRALKKEQGQDIVVLGSPRLAQFLLKERLVDELKLTISPTVLGQGLHLFECFETSLSLEEVETMTTGVLAVSYKVS